METVELKIQEGPVTIPSLKGAGVNASFDLWRGIRATELFPPVTESAFYNLSIFSSTDDPDEVERIAMELTRAHQFLAQSWSFAGGSMMLAHTFRGSIEAKSEGNVDEVRTALLAKKGLIPVSQALTVQMDTVATYRQAPLGIASQIAKEMNQNAALAEFLRLFQGAWIDRYRPGTPGESWYVSLYKIRDELKGLFGGTDDSARSALGISKTKWSYLGEVVNRDGYRHSKPKERYGAIPSAEVDEVFGIAREWIVAYMQKLGLPTAA